MSLYLQAVKHFLAVKCERHIVGEFYNLNGTRHHSALSPWQPIKISSVIFFTFVHRNMFDLYN